jgi:hypothetical protein
MVWYSKVWHLLDGIQLASTDENDVVAEVPLPVAVRHARHLNRKYRVITFQESKYNIKIQTQKEYKSLNCRDVKGARTFLTTED